jgi:hypothetical protein
VELDRYNGVPSLLILEIDEVPFLAWMIHGHGQASQVWVYLPLLPEEVEELVDKPDTPLAEWVTQRKGRAAYLGLADAQGVLIVVVPWRVPNVEPRSLLFAVVSGTRAEIQRAMVLYRQSELPEPTSQVLKIGEKLSRALAEVS